MSFVIAAPDLLTDAAGALSDLNSTISQANVAAASPTTAVLAAGADEVSAAIATLFSGHGRAFQSLSTEASAFHTEFVQALNKAGAAYAGAEAANASPLQAAERSLQALAVFTPVKSMTGRPLVGNGANGTTNAQGVGTPGKPGGILLGNGGNGGDSIATGVPGGAGGSAGLIGKGGTGGMGGWGARGGTGGTGGWLWGDGGTGGIGGPTATGGVGGNALLFGKGGTGGLGGEPGPAVPEDVGTDLPAGTGGVGGHGGMLIGNGGTGGQGGVVSGTGGQGGASGDVGHTGATGAAGGAPTAHLQMKGTKPQIAISVDGGPTVYATADTAATKVLLPPKYVNMAALGDPIQKGLTVRFGAAPYTKVETYNTYTAEVDFGNGMVTEPTTVGVITSVTQSRPDGTTYNVPQSQWRALIGMGDNVPPAIKAPFYTNAVQALPGTLNQGVLVNQPAHYFQFGPNPLTPITSVPGAPLSGDLLMSVDNGSYVAINGGTIDSAGAMGYVPASSFPDTTLGGRVPVGTTITVATGDPAAPTVLYTQEITPTTTLPYTPYTVSDNRSVTFNSGNYPFTKFPIYSSYSPSGVGTTIFDTPNT